MAEIPFEKRLIIPKHVLAQAIRGELTFLNLASERYFALNQVGSRMWEVLSNSESIQAACETLLEEYDVDATRLRSDLQILISKLLESSLVQIDDT